MYKIYKNLICLLCLSIFVLAGSGIKKSQNLANNFKNINLLLNQVSKMFVSEVYAAAAFEVNFNLNDNAVTTSKILDGAVTGPKLGIPAAPGQFLKYNGSSWVAASFVDGQTYMGAWDASSHTFPAVSEPGDYWIVSVAGVFGVPAINYSLGDWIITDGYIWQKIGYSKVVTSFNGRKGVVTLVPTDYVSLRNGSGKIPGSSLGDFADIDLVANGGLSDGKILKWSATNSKWELGDDIAVGPTVIGAGTITDTHVSATAEIDQSKISGLVTALAAKQNSATLMTDIKLTGLGARTGVISSGDTILEAFEKLKNTQDNIIPKDGAVTSAGVFDFSSPGTFLYVKTPAGNQLTQAANVEYVQNYANDAINAKALWTKGAGDSAYYTAGNVGIGTTTPAFKLSLDGTATPNDRKIGITGTQALYLPDQDAGQFLGSLFIGNGGQFLANVSGIDGQNNTGVGIGALLLNTIGNNNTATGYNSLGSNTSGNENTAIGSEALSKNTTGNQNTASGALALFSNTFGASNTALGFKALYSNTSGNNNTASGDFSLNLNSTGSNNTASGASALSRNTTGSFNTSIGVSAADYNTTGTYIVALGHEAARYYGPTGSSEMKLAKKSVYIGAGTRGFSNTDDNTIVIGNNAVSIGSNSVVIGNSSITKTALNGSVGIGTTTPTSILHTVASGAKTAHYTGNLLTNTATSSTASIEKIGLDIQSTGLWGGASALNTGLSVSVSGGAVNYAGVFQGGNVGIGTTAPLAPLHVLTSNVSGDIAIFKSTGGIGCSISWDGTACSSDSRLKEHIVSVDNTQALNNLLQLRPVHFSWIADSKHKKQTGYIAQELEKYFPEFVKTDSSGYKQVNYAHFVSVLTASIQELYNKNIVAIRNQGKTLDQEMAIQSDEMASKADKVEMEALKKENADLKERLDKIEMALSKKYKKHSKL